MFRSIIHFREKAMIFGVLDFFQKTNEEIRRVRLFFGRTTKNVSIYVLSSVSIKANKYFASAQVWTF